MIVSISRELKCVVSLGICFMTLFACKHTLANMQKTIVSSILDEQPGFNVEGYTVSALTYTMFTLVVLFLAPYISHAIGPRLTMFVCCFGTLFSTVFYLLEVSWLFYFGAVITGVTTGIMWPSQARYVIQNSSPQNLPRNSSIFWLIYTCSSLIGNIFVYFSFQGKKYIDGFTRRVSLYCLLAINILAVIEFAFLPRSISKHDEIKIYGPIKTLKIMWSLFKKKRVMWLCVYLVYAGLQQAMWAGIYSPSVGFTLAFGNSVKELVALSGMAMSVGSIAGSLFTMVLSGCLSRQRYARRLLVTLGGMASLCTYAVGYLNLPNDASFGNTNRQSIIQPPSTPLALLGSFCICFGDAIINTQLYSIIGHYYREQSVEACALYRFVKNIFVSVGFFWCNYLGLHIQLAVLGILTFLGVLCFWVADSDNVPRFLKEEPEQKVSVEERGDLKTT